MEIKTEIENIKECLAGYTGGVYAQAYAAIEFLESELETLRASNRIKQANIERLEAEIVHLKTEILCLNHERDALLAEREAMMKQVPVYQYHNSGNSWCDCNKNVYDAMKDEYRRIVYISPLPAQQIPEVTLPEKKPVPVPDISIQAWDSQDFENSAYNNAIDDMAEILINQGYAIRKPTKR